MRVAVKGLPMSSILKRLDAPLPKANLGARLTSERQQPAGGNDGVILGIDGADEPRRAWRSRPNYRRSRTSSSAICLRGCRITSQDPSDSIWRCGLRRF
jgi:hypothetical protein